jgi:hypothetical protein
MWTRASGGPFDYTTAQAYCASQKAGGFADWRMPSWIELVSVVDYARGYPAINVNAFPATPTNWFWSSTPTLAAGLRLCVLFGDGTVSALSTAPSTTASMRCVRTP